MYLFRSKLIILSITLLVVHPAISDGDLVRSGGDSYVNAHRSNTHVSKSGKVNRDAADYYPYGTADEFNTSPVFYHTQNEDYVPSKVEYGPPKPEYGPPKPGYGLPPVKDFAPTSQFNKYGPASNYYHFVQPVADHSYGTPYSMLLPGLLDKLKFKLNLFTIGKIILKLIIFKKIVSLLAILCLLMFLPTLKHIKEPAAHGEDREDDDGIMKRSLQVKTNDQVNNLTGHLLNSINSFSNKHETQNNTWNSPKKCGSFSCKSKVFLKYLDKKYSYKSLANAYLEEEFRRNN